jgi:hypothetical protein
MGKTLQVRGTIQCVDLRTLNAEISEVIKEDMSEVDKRSIKELVIAGSTEDFEVNFENDGICPAKFLYFKSDNAVLVKTENRLADGNPWTFAVLFGEFNKLYITTTVETTIRIIALS